MSNKTVNETTKILLEAKELINSPKTWIKGHQKQTVTSLTGEIIITRYCILGAIESRVTNHWLSKQDEYSPQKENLRAVSIFRAANQMLKKSYLNSVAYWNDAGERTHEQVMEAFDRAIEFSLTEKADV